MTVTTFVNFIIACSVCITSVQSLTVDVKGALSLGREVLDTLSYYLTRANGRRNMYTLNEPEAVEWMVKSASLCKEVPFCDEKYSKIVDEYVTLLSKAVKIVYTSAVMHNSSDNTQQFSGINDLESLLSKCYQEIKKLIVDANAQVTDDNLSWVWINLFKKICAKFQMDSTRFIDDHLDSNNTDIAKAKMTQRNKIITALIVVENSFLDKLCDEHNICTESYECTAALNTVLNKFKTIPDYKAREFVRIFYENLPQTKLFSILDDETKINFEFVLNEMAFTKVVPTNMILIALQRTVEKRLEILEKKKVVLSKSRDIQLANVILSDMDHLYSRSRKEPFRAFLKYYKDWADSGGSLKKQVSYMMKELTTELSTKPEDLIMKMSNEVRTFLENTILKD